MRVPIVTQKRIQNPPLTFEVREGVGVAVVTQKRIGESQLTFEVREGVEVVIVAQKEKKNTRTPPCI